MTKSITTLVTLLSLLACGSPAFSNDCEKPNILFIFADDMCYEALGATGELDIDTPNLDRLSAMGTNFRHAYNMGSWTGAVCVASRTMLNTGRFVWNAKALGRLDDEIAAGEMWSQQMSAAGYKTYMTGKWHVPKTNPEDIFDVVTHVRPGMPKQRDAGYNRPLNPEDYENGWKPWDREQGGFWKDGKHWSEVLGDDGVGFIEAAAKEDDPFFMYLAFNAPHDPRQSPKEYVDMYPLDRIAIPENFLPENPRAEGMGSGRAVRDEKLAPFPRTEYSIKVNRQEYFAIVTHMDVQVGRLLDALEASGKADNTYIFFTADHGLAVGHHGLVGKQNMYEHSLRPPFIVAGPGVEKGKWLDERVYLQDIMPTSLELAGAEIPDYVQFKSILPLLEDESAGHYEAIYGGFKMSFQRAVIQDDWKLIVYPLIPAKELYSLKDDPLEMNDLSAWPAYAGKIAQLESALRKLQKETGDQLDLDNPGDGSDNEKKTRH